jgi:hypothetical protein
VLLRKKMVAEAAAERCDGHRGTVEVQLRVEARWHWAEAFKAAATRSARWCVGRRTSSGQSYMGYRTEARCSTMRLRPWQGWLACFVITEGRYGGLAAARRAVATHKWQAP